MFLTRISDCKCKSCNKEYSNGLLNWEYDLEENSLYCNDCFIIFLENIITTSCDIDEINMAQNKLEKLYNFINTKGEK